MNRLDGEDKEYGYIIDYKDLFHSLKSSIKDYTSDAFKNYEKADVEGLLKDRLNKGRERLEEARESIKALCEPVGPEKSSDAYRHYFCAKDTSKQDELKANEKKRIELYKQTVGLIRVYANLANEMTETGYSSSQIEEIKNEVKHYEQVRQEVKLASGDYIDLKMYEPAMRHLIDTYIRAEESEVISAFDDLTLIQLIVERGTAALDQLPKPIRQNKQAVAETIENNLRKVIIDEQPINPKYYERMSVLLNELIQQRRADALAYEQYLQRIVALSKQVQSPSASATYPSTLDTNAKRALYDNLGQDEALVLALDQAIRSTKKDDWRGNPIKKREKWTMPIRNWKAALQQFAILFENRLPLELLAQLST